MIGMLVLIAGIERGYFRDNLAFKENVAVCWKRSTQVTAKHAPGKEVLCFGDSMVKFGLLPRVLEARTGWPSYNLALHGGSPPASYFALRHALDAGARPKTVIADFGWEILAEGPASHTRTYPWTELLSTAESLELITAARDPELFISLALQRTFPSVAYRAEIREAVRLAFRGAGNEQASITAMLLRNWDANAGAIVIPKKPEFEDIAVPPGAPRQGDWRCHPVNAVYLRRFFELAAREHIQVVWLLPPVSPGTQAKWERSGNERLFEQFIRSALTRFANVDVVDGRHAGFDRSVFVDGVHLDRDGAAALSLGVADLLRGPLAPGSGKAPRWVSLPHYRASAMDGLVEDYVQTKLAMAAAGAKR
jgi:hypothetical protein